MGRVPSAPLPAFTPERFADRLAEAIALSQRPERFRALPAWLQRTMTILKEQLVPPEYAAALAVDQAVFADGVLVAWLAQARDTFAEAGTAEGRFARQVAARLAPGARSRRAVGKVASGEFAASPELQRHVMARLFSTDASERRAFAEGLATGNRARELFDRQAAHNTTDATIIYLWLWLYWPEIAALRSVGEAAQALEGLFAPNPNLAGRHWEERFRKLANRIGLSFRARQIRRPKE
jgi:hypothetical protein